MFEMTSTGGANETHSNRLGLFNIQENKVNGRPHYINENGEHLYWIETYNGVWLVIR